MGGNLVGAEGDGAEFIEFLYFGGEEGAIVDATLSWVRVTSWLQYQAIKKPPVHGETSALFAFETTFPIWLARWVLDVACVGGPIVTIRSCVRVRPAV